MKKIGILIPSTNLTVEYELQYLFNKNYFNSNDIVFYSSKLQYKTNYKEDKEKFLNDLALDSNKRKEELGYLGVDYVAFFCTSSALFNDNVKSINNPAKSLVISAKDKKIVECLLITPYDEKIGSEIKTMLEKNNIRVNKMINLNLLHTKEYFEFGMKKLENFIDNNYLREYGDVIISCTNIPTIHFIDRLEKKLNIKIISSNSSLFEHIKRDNEISE